MARAYERASKRVNAVSEAVLAELIQRDVQSLTEAALGETCRTVCWPICVGAAHSAAGLRHASAHALRLIAAERGVTAYLERPVQRERLNERFLQSTIRGVQNCEYRLAY